VRRELGSRLEFGQAKERGELLMPTILDQVNKRLAQPEAHQLIQQERLWADPLSSQPMCCNLFGELAADLGLAGGGWLWRPTALATRTVTAALGVALLPAAARYKRR
jgi:hypothetical protein